MKKNEFDLNDFLDSMQQMKKMGGIGDILNMIPGMSRQLKGQEIDEKPLKKTEAIILSMTPEPLAMRILRDGLMHLGLLRS